MKQKAKVILIIIVLIILAIAIGGYYAFRARTHSTIQKVSSKSANSSWLTYSKSYSSADLGVTLKYPSEWIVTKNGVHSGHPNLAIFYNSDHSQCIELSYSGWPTSSLEEEFKNVFDYDSQPNNKVVSATTLTINGHPAEVKTVTLKGKEFLDSVVNLGKATQGMDSYTNLSTCGMAEQSTFMTVLKSIKTIRN